MVTTANPPVLEYKNVVAGYGPIQALHDVSLTVNQGEIVTLIGANGAGKSTLLMSLFGTPKISTGQILFKGERLDTLETHQIAQRGIGLSPEGRRIFPKMSIEDNLRLGDLNIKKEKAVQQALKEVYDLFPILKERRQHRAGLLSGGEQQMLAMGRSLIARPALFLVDEPSLGLAPQMVSKVFNILKTIAQSGTTIFLVEQNANHALNLANRAYVMVNGRITLCGSGQELLSNEGVRNAYLGGH